MTTPRDDSPRFDPEAVHAKYAEERAKRAWEGRAAIRDLTRDEVFAKYREDPFTPHIERDPIAEDIDVAVIGAGIAGVVVGARLRDEGLERIRLIDEAGGVGGTWYWNQYPGVMCDVESYSYMPMLEEMDYIPTKRYAFGEEIRAHIESIARKYDLLDDGLFHTTVQESRWDEDRARWIITTDRGDEIRARYLVMAVGILNRMKLPAIPGMENFKGKSFHSGRWDYAYTGGSPDGNLSNLADKVVGIIGTGATAIQAVPPLAESSKQLYVFQRTPSAVGVRGNGPTPPDFTENLKPGWQRERIANFTAVLIGHPVEEDLVADGWTAHMAKVMNPDWDPEASVEDNMLNMEAVDFAIMEEHRARVEELVTDPETAEILKPYYRYLCKRPCFHDEYLQAFNLPNVTLVDCPGGIEKVTEKGLVIDGKEYELDCIIYATGFEAEMTPLPRRAAHPIIGRNGLSIEEKWKDGSSTLHGIMTRGFPNLFLMPAPGQQAIVSVNITHVSLEGADHIAATAALLDKRGVRSFDVSEEAEAAWVAEIVSGYTDASAFMLACTPSRLNFEGDPSVANPRNGSYGPGFGDIFGWIDVLARWREQGDFEGLELDETPRAS